MLCYDLVELSMPSFVHDFGDWERHTYRGSLRRHVAVERVLRFFQWVLNVVVGDACPAYELLYAPVHMGFGLNCNFPRRDVALFVAWSLKIACGRRMNR